MLVLVSGGALYFHVQDPGLKATSSLIDPIWRVLVFSCSSIRYLFVRIIYIQLFSHTEKVVKTEAMTIFQGWSWVVPICTPPGFAPPRLGRCRSHGSKRLATPSQRGGGSSLEPRQVASEGGFHGGSHFSEHPNMDPKCCSPLFFALLLSFRWGRLASPPPTRAFAPLRSSTAIASHLMAKFNSGRLLVVCKNYSWLLLTCCDD